MVNEKGMELRKLIQKQYGNIIGVVVLRDGKITYESYFNGFDQNHTVHVASVTKSVMSALIGIAVDKGAINSIDQGVLEYFPKYKIKRGEATIKKITIQNLLTMTAPYKFKYEPYTKVYST